MERHATRVGVWEPSIPSPIFLSFCLSLSLLSLSLSLSFSLCLSLSLSHTHSLFSLSIWSTHLFVWVLLRVYARCIRPPLRACITITKGKHTREYPPIPLSFRTHRQTHTTAIASDCTAAAIAITSDSAGSWWQVLALVLMLVAVAGGWWLAVGASASASVLEC